MERKNLALVFAFIVIAAFIGVFIAQALISQPGAPPAGGKYTLTVNVGRPAFDVEVRTIEDQARALAITKESGVVQFSLEQGVYVVSARSVVVPGIARSATVILDGDRTIDLSPSA
ncbi:MAG: hypothetical protein HY518_03030 [Candidatus Aenigmarchaeota archaeon]|nr:hypothetical protein [Candidatus Aenigmarchaeota archaeon]